MSEAFYLRLRQTATRLIRSRGRPVILRRRGEPVTGGEDTPWRPDRSEPVDLPATIVEVVGIMTQEPGTLVKVSDLEGVLESETAPLKTDRLVDGDTVYQFVEIKPIQPGPTAVMYVFHARR